MKALLVDFTVRGYGEFPLDMLRYDGCFPVDGTAVAAIQAVNRRDVRLRTINYMPSIGRWESFGWKVLSIDGHALQTPRTPEQIAAEEQGVSDAEARIS